MSGSSGRGALRSAPPKPFRKLPGLSSHIPRINSHSVRAFWDFLPESKAYSGGFVYSGQYSRFRRRRHGNSSREITADHLVVFSQNHDQIGNRAAGERLSQIVSFESLKLAAGTVLLSSFAPMLFMSEEYAETSPSQYFVSHGDEKLICNVRDGRRKEVEHFKWPGIGPDPQSPETFLRSKLHWEQRQHERHKLLLSFYTNLLELRRKVRALSPPDKRSFWRTGFKDASLGIAGTFMIPQHHRRP